MAHVVDVAAFWGAVLASFGFGVRRFMLKPGLGTWASAGPAVQVALVIGAVAMGAAAVSVAAGHCANEREVFAYWGVAIMAWLMVANLHLTGRVAAPPSPLNERTTR